ncbi:MAG: hypothetical protein HY350_00660 [Candidatus Omnitrophica bacterium]|nr:hypothetical protein [Candidatus Omnitrophota bacterium]
MIGSGIFRKIKNHPLNKYLVYFHKDGIGRKISVMARPRPISIPQYKYCFSVCGRIMSSFRSAFNLYLRFPEVRELFYFTPEEEEWLNLYKPVSPRQYQPVVGRFDSNATFIDEKKFADFKIFEINGVALGAIFYEAVVEEMTYDLLREISKSGIASPSARNDVIAKSEKMSFPSPLTIREDKLQRESIATRQSNLPPYAGFIPQKDVRDALWETLASCGHRIGIKNPAIAFLEDKADKLGTPEYKFFVEYYRKQGKKAYRVGPRELYLQGDEIYYRGNKIDLVYRDLELEDLVRIEEKYGRLDAIRHAFKNRRIISSLAGDFDQKSVLELFTDEQYAKYFTGMKDAFRHILWTRLVRETGTKDPKGKKIDLIKYARKKKEKLVLKPNRGLGGSGIIFGEEVSRRRWDKAIEDAISNPKSYVVQELAPVHKEKFPVLPGGKLRLKDFYTDSGFVVFEKTLGILSRVSSKEVVNIAQGGGICATLLYLP